MTALDFNPDIGLTYRLDTDLRRLTAPNPSPMTFRGTNTYLLGRNYVAVIDPGPDIESHFLAILSELEPGQRISHILVTHSHLDHSPLAARLSQHTGAQIYGFGPSGAGQSAIMRKLGTAGNLGGGEGSDPNFKPDVLVADGDIITGSDWQLQALWTPGHFGNHLCFADPKRMFCGDHVMGWATSLVSPPDGDLTQFMASSARLQDHPASIYYPGHGAPIENPQERLQWLIDHRQTREAEIIKALQDGPKTVGAITAQVYQDTPKHLHSLAARNVLAHLIDLVQRTKARSVGPLSAEAEFQLID
ncbi:MBL fold metallo-hydrolase [Algirhabdus cladophorae]|uniref:MBL fold metallo-hydrolase n=1 Tax=Algirhabdus cladophorae TaxID=3377108 RepID=UPI003B84B13B